MSRLRRLDATFLLALPAAMAVVAVALRLEGGQLHILLQPSAALVVFGGTIVAVVFSFPIGLLFRTWRALAAAFGGARPPDRALLARIGEYATRARQRGTLALEGDVAGAGDPFLARAIALVVDGVAPADVRHTLKAFSEAREEADSECALVLEAAAGYAPTLGILGAVLGLMQAMANLAEPGRLGPAIAVAFVATVYGVGSANLVFLPLATRLRGLCRTAALNREVIIEGAVAIQQGMHPALIDSHLRGLLAAWHGEAPVRKGRTPAAKLVAS